MRAVSIEQLIDRRIDKWRTVQLPRHEAGARPRRPAITISRDFGAGGRQVAETLAAEMDLVLFDREIITNIAERAHISEGIVATLDEHHRSSVESWVEGILKARLFDRTEYIQHLLKVVKTLAIRGGCIMLGRGVNFALLNEPGVYHFRIAADEAYRVSHIAELWQMSREEAAKVVTVTTQERRQYLKKLFPKFNPDDPLAYHMIFNSGRMSLDMIAKIIRDFVESSEKQRRAF